MLNKLRDFFMLPSARSLETALPSPHTPDFCILEQQPMHWIFDHSNLVHTPAAFNEVYTDQRFHAWEQNHVDGTPPLIFNSLLHPSMPSPRARLRGKLHVVTPKDLELLDKKLANRVQSERKRVRLVFPNFKEKNIHKSMTGTPIKISAWVYYSNSDFWKNLFDYDYDMWRGRQNSGFVPAKTIKDSRAWIRDYFVFEPRKAIQPKVMFGFRDNDGYKRNIIFEEKEYYEQLKEDAKQQQEDKKPTHPLPQVS